MSRVAVVIANSVTAQPTQKALRSSKVRRTARQLNTLLSKLPDKYAFTIRLTVDEHPSQVKRIVERASNKCRKQGDLLLVYYFGHARREGDDLAFVHPGAGKDRRAYLSFESLFHTVMAGMPKAVLFLLDCCYAGAAKKQFELLTDRSKHCLIACTTPSTRAFFEEGLESPIGSFSRAIIDGLSSPRGTVSHGNEITVESLFQFVRSETERRTGNKQEPYMQGNLTETLSIYLPRPEIIPGITGEISPKCGYSKLLATVLTIGKRRFDNTRILYQAITGKHREEFLTNSRDQGGRPKLANWAALRRYVAFLRAIHIVDEDELMLTVRGLRLIEEPETNYNVRLLKLLTEYLERQNGLTIQELRDAMQRVLHRRWIPTRENVLQDLPPAKGNYLSESHMGLVLDLLGCIGEIGTMRKREQVYFPWIESPEMDNE